MPSLLSAVILLFVLVPDSLLSLSLVSHWKRETYACTHLSAACDDKYAHLSLRRSAALFLLAFSQPRCVVAYMRARPLRRHTHRREYACTPMSPNHCKQQTVVSPSPRSTGCCVVKSFVVFFNKFLGAFCQKIKAE